MICEKLSKRFYNKIKNIFTGKPTTKLYICMDIECSEGLKYCCMSCGQNKTCKVACEDFNGPCTWRVEHGKNQR